MYVLKASTSPSWNPQHEFAAIVQTESIFRRNGSAGIGGVIEAVAYGVEPRFLITRFQAGRLVQDVFDEAMVGDGRHAWTCAEHCAAGLARWLAEFRAGGARDGQDRAPDACLAWVWGMEERLSAAGMPASRRAACVRAIESHVTQLDAAEQDAMSRAYPHRGDCRPKNFILGEDQRLYGLDLEGFGYGPLDADAGCLRQSLELQAMRDGDAAARATALWRAFWDCYVGHGGTPRVLLLSYVHYVLQEAERLESRGRSRVWSAKLPAWRRYVRGLRVGRRRRRWLASRWQWLGALTGNMEMDAALCRERL